MDDSTGFIDLFIFSSSLHSVAWVWCTLIYFPSATKPGTTTKSSWIFQWFGGRSIQYGFPKKCSDFCIQALPLLQELDCTIPPGHLRPRWLRAVMGGWRSSNISRACTKVTTPNPPIRSAKGSADPHPRILGLLPCLKKMRQTTKQTTRLQCCVSGRDGDFTLTQQNLIPRTQQMLFCWNSVILSFQSHFLSIPTPRCCFDSLEHYSLQTTGCTPGMFWMCREAKSDRHQHKEERHKLLSALCCLNSLWSHFLSCRWIIEDFSDSCSPFSTTERSLNDFFLVWAS